MLPIGFLLTMYTITGYDASAHIAEETHGAPRAAAQGVWRSIFYSAIIGWFVLLAFLFAADRRRRASTTAPASSLAIFSSARSTPLGCEAGAPDLHASASSSAAPPA